VAGGVVAIDADDRHAFGLILAGQPGESGSDVLDVGAVVADESCKKGGSLGEIR
jgi:hypothetical protein